MGVCVCDTDCAKTQTHVLLFQWELPRPFVFSSQVTLSRRIVSTVALAGPTPLGHIPSLCRSLFLCFSFSSLSLCAPPFVFVNHVLLRVILCAGHANYSANSSRLTVCVLPLLAVNIFLWISPPSLSLFLGSFAPSGWCGLCVCVCQGHFWGMLMGFNKPRVWPACESESSGLITAPF